MFCSIYWYAHFIIVFIYFKFFTNAIILLYPPLGFTPRAPDVLYLDTTRPVMTRWYRYLNQSLNQKYPASITVLLFFNEPVLVVNTSHIELYHTTKTTSGNMLRFGTKPLPLAASNSRSLQHQIKYSEFSRRVEIQLTNYCTDYGESMLGSGSCLGSSDPAANLFAFLNQSVQSSPDQHAYFAVLGENAVQDFALVPNFANVISERKSQIEGSPGMCGL